MWRARATLFCLVVSGGFVSSFAFAGWVSETDSALAVRVGNSLKIIANTEDLSPREEGYAIQMAATWFYLGPCEGDSRKLSNDGFYTIQSVAGAETISRSGRAILTMIGFLERESFGRKPTEQLCKFAYEVAVPDVPADPQ